jgi:hypothetical protein
MDDGPDILLAIRRCLCLWMFCRNDHFRVDSLYKEGEKMMEGIADILQDLKKRMDKLGEYL